MTSIKGVPCFLFLVLGITYVHAIEQNCIIPRFARFRRTLYRPKSGPSTSNYPAGSVINHGSTIMAICKKDIYGDMVTAWTSSECNRGKWIPKLPSCKEQKRCRAPPSIQHATASERITPYITFPHGTSVTYTCDVGKMATGSDTVVCKDGKWSDTSFKCEVDPDFKPDTTTVPSSDTCSQLTIENGRISVKDMSNSTYDVTCNAGFRLRFAKTYRCRHGRWIGAKPECVRVVQYRLHIKYDGERSIYVLLDGSLQSCVQFQLDPNGQDGVRKYEVPAVDTGEITRIRASYSSQCSDEDASVDSLTFVSLYKEDTGEFYIERFNQDGGSRPTPIRGRPCKRQFEQKSNKRLPAQNNENENAYSGIIDATDCQLKCIEEEEFNCQIAYYSSDYQTCIVSIDVPLDDFDEVRQTVSSFKRTDTCSTE